MNEQEVTPEILGVLRSMDLLKGKDPDELTEWLGKAPFEGGAECVLRQYAPGDRITTEGSFGNTFFVLTSGTVGVTLGPEGQRLATHLRTIPDFADLDAGIVRELVKQVRLRIFSKDEVIVREGDDADSFYLIREGYVRVVKDMTADQHR